MHFVHNTTLQFTNFIISQLPINYKVSNKLNFYFKKKKKTLTDKNNYLPLKKYAIHISTKREKKKEKKKEDKIQLIENGGYQSTTRLYTLLLFSLSHCLSLLNRERTLLLSVFCIKQFKRFFFFFGACCSLAHE